MFLQQARRDGRLLPVGVGEEGGGIGRERVLAVLAWMGVRVMRIGVGVLM